jgi:hypothetical protein
VRRQEIPDLAIVLLPQHIETSRSIELVTRDGFGYLSKDRILDVDAFLDALRRVAPAGRLSTSRSSPASSERPATAHYAT